MWLRRLHGSCVAVATVCIYLCADLEHRDPAGNTPLLLAYALGRTRAARMLIEAAADAKARDPKGWETVHIACLTGNPDLVRSAVIGMLRESQRAWERRLPTVQRNLASVCTRFAFVWLIAALNGSRFCLPCCCCCRAGWGGAGQRHISRRRVRRAYTRRCPTSQ